MTLTIEIPCNDGVEMENNLNKAIDDFGQALKKKGFSEMELIAYNLDSEPIYKGNLKEIAMSNLEKWIQAIMTEDFEKISIGTVRTLQIIKHEFERLQKENVELQKENQFLRMEISRLKDEDNS